MAYISQEKKKELTPGIKAVLNKYGVKASLSINHYSVLVCTISKGGIDFKKLSEKQASISREEGEYYKQVNIFHIESMREGVAKDFLLELKQAMMQGKHDNSDAQTDYFDVGWYVNINIGQRDKSYILT